MTMPTYLYAGRRKAEVATGYITYLARWRDAGVEAEAVEGGRLLGKRRGEGTHGLQVGQVAHHRLPTSGRRHRLLRTLCGAARVIDLRGVGKKVARASAKLALRRLLSAPDRVQGCPNFRPASANQPRGPRWPAVPALASTPRQTVWP